MTEATSPARELSADELMALMIDAASLLEGEGKQNIPAILRAAASLIRELTEWEKGALGLLQSCAEFLEPYSDVVDGAYGEPSPNAAMSLLSSIKEALGEA